MEMELEDGAKELAEEVSKSNPDFDTMKVQMLLPVLCSIAISLKKLAEEANAATANMNMGQIK